MTHIDEKQFDRICIKFFRWFGIDNELEGYKTFHKHSNEGLIRKWPKSYRLHGWLLSMKSGGELRPHIHENGWISGSIYINVPFKIKRNDGN